MKNLMLACQEQLLPGGSLVEKFQTAKDWGFDSLELRGKGEGQFKARVPEIKEAVSLGVVVTSVCVEMSHFVGDFNLQKREDAIDQMIQQLEVVSEIGARLAMTPASYGMFSKRLPPFMPPRTDLEDQEILIDSFGRLATKAESLGVLVALEPLNRYEDHMINTLGQASELIRAVGSSSLGIAADTYHMNIEEAQIEESLKRYARDIIHIQVSDSNRLEPGAGHINWQGLLATLDEINFDHELTFECRLSENAEISLPRSTSFLRQVNR